MQIDQIITGGRVIDGSGNPWRHQDVLLAGDRIVDLVPPGSVHVEEARRWHAGGRFVCPGFIDIQSHSIISLMQDGRSVSKTTQGVTTEIMGELWTPAPAGGLFPDPLSGYGGQVSEAWQESARDWKSFADWLCAVERAGVSPNIGSYASAGTLRRYTKGMSPSAASPDELEQMKCVASEAMETGAFGVSYALIYPPHIYASTTEIVEICKVIARYGGHYITHMRSESAKILQGLEEAMKIGQEANIPVEIYHLKAAGRISWPLMPEVVKRIENARERGQDISANMYPYEASATSLTTCLPKWLEWDGNFYESLKDPQIRQRIHEEINDPTSDYDGQIRSASPENIMPIGLRLSKHQPYIGMRLSEIARIRNSHCIDVVLDLLLEERQPIQSVFFQMNEENSILQIRQSWVTISTDGAGLSPEWAKANGPVHPRAYGTYPRVFRKYVREQKILSWEEAVRKMTSAVADRLRLKKRGRIEPGYYADIVIFDPETIGDRATFLEPHQLSTGIRDVLVNGSFVVRDGEHTGSKPGRFVRPGAN